jgi:hypothetical protein
VSYQQLLNRMTKSMLGNGATESIIAKDGKVTFKKYHKHRRRLNRLNKEVNQSRKQLEHLHRSCVNHLRPVTEPLALISQIQRSGGSLLSQLFDGHPQLHAHPHELKIGYIDKYTWPQIDLDDHPRCWFEMLFESNVIKHFKVGYKKQKNMDETFLFLFLPSVQRDLFLTYIDSVDSTTLRDVFDAYMTSYFGAWLNYQNTSGDKKFITAFTPRLAMGKDNVESFFKIYPDGRLISIIRDPKNWYPSAVRHKPLVYEDIRSALDLWIKSAKTMLWNKERFGDRVCVIRFEDLIEKTESAMRYLAVFLKIEFDDILLIPTFNRSIIQANTSFDSRESGIIKSTLVRHKTLTNNEIKIIDEMTNDIYHRITHFALSMVNTES